MRRASLIFLILAVLASSMAPAAARPRWKRQLDRLVRRRSMSVAVRHDGEQIYAHRARRRRAPASNQKLLLSMALLDELGPRHRIPTLTAARRRDGSVVTGNLWILGRGDPTISQGRLARSLPRASTRVSDIARSVKRAGVTRVEGRVKAARSYFLHDWFAPGWLSYFPDYYVALPSALTLNGNSFQGRHIHNPERRLARALTRKLRSLGVMVGRRAGAGSPPGNLERISQVTSPRLSILLRHQNRVSSNFFAEMLGKRLAAELYGAPGSIARAAAAIQRWVEARSVGATAYDSSGLSYLNRISARGLTRLLAKATRRQWGQTLRKSLAGGGQGTLKDRLRGVPVRAKTGTLSGVSALSGWIRLRRRQSWAEFSILSRGLAKRTAVRIENRIARRLRKSAR